MDNTFVSLLQALGLNNFIPLLLALHGLASALDALIPQPAPGSNWLPARKLLSIIAGNVGNARNADQPDLSTWFDKMTGILEILARALPPSAAAPKAHIEPTVSRTIHEPIGPDTVIPLSPPAPEPLFPPRPSTEI